MGVAYLNVLFLHSSPGSEEDRESAVRMTGNLAAISTRYKCRSLPLHQSAQCHHHHHHHHHLKPQSFYVQNLPDVMLLKVVQR